jgi:hypothetical protein
MTDLQNGMGWRVMVELTGADGVVLVYGVSAGGSAMAFSPAPVGPTTGGGKQTLVGLQRHLRRQSVGQSDHWVIVAPATSRCKSVPWRSSVTT